MPIYEYHCHACGQHFEQLVRAGRAPACPHCQSPDLEKQLSVFATPQASSVPAAGPCGTCGNPAGPGACRWN